MDPNRKRPRAPGMLYGSLSLALILVLSTLALKATQPPPPSIAEFAPQAVEQITDAPSEQASELGSRGGRDDLEAGTSDDASTRFDPSKPPPIEVSRVRRCVGDPPRQIEDPQSPPCVPYWVGNNGGSTYQGVTGNEIVVAFAEDWGESWEYEIKTMERFFNRRFEFYGRQLRFERYPISGGFTNARSAEMQRDAVIVDEEIQAFAALGYGQRGGNERIYYDELARRKVLSVSSMPTIHDAAHREAMAPYQWSYLPGPDVVGRNLGSWTCATLAGGTADHAGGREALEQRKFGIWRSLALDGSGPDLTPLLNALDRCGIQPEVIVETKEPAGDLVESEPSHRSAVIRLQERGVTTILCLCHVGALIWGGKYATNQGFFPEWVMTSWIQGDEDVWVQAADSQQNQNVMGLGSWSKRLPIEQLPCNWAGKEIDPNFEWPDHNRGLHPGYEWCHFIYKPLLLLASGIQMAGPNLTPHTFQAGMRRAEFPNPSAGGPPLYEAHVKFGVRDHTMNDDAAVIWWNPAQRSHEGRGNAPGTYCYSEMGRRWKDGSWPPYETLFDRSAPCR